MEPNNIDIVLTYSIFTSGSLALFLIILNAVAYGLTEGKDGPNIKQMIACLVAIAVFILSGFMKIIRNID